MDYFRFMHRNWLFLLAGFLITFTSSYGQTYFISLFAGEIKGDFGLSDGQWGGIYTIGTTLSAITMIWAGVLTDRFRVRALALLVMIGLALACVAMAWVANWVLLVLVIFALRLTGQGMMSQLGAVAMVRWFEASRGKALSLASMGFAAGQAVLPVVFVALFAVMHWRSLWLLAAVLVILTIPFLLILLRRERTPQSMADEAQIAGMHGRHWTRGEMLRSGLFFLMIPMVVGPSAWGTALFFQQVHLVEVKGWELVAFVALMPIYTLAAVVATFASGWAIDRFGVSRVVPVQMIPFGLGFAVLAYADTIFWAGIGLMIFGVGQGLQSTGASAFWPEYYGTRHIGSIKSVAAALMVFGSAIGPGVTGAFIDFGVDFPDQMLPIAIYYFAAAGLATFGIVRYRPTLGR
ncbi:MFS transporter [Sulfitobacter mediterraneus]|uniref:MFS transporter n=1 Tax=Sulfitobacter mediterraneus TaxID=83219 RepID=UPI001939DB43|nr:MFS transporter [Sulfitobacter mediterraneus]MBM1555363.1 MFS transporter [Sulfitobacter mediterraneus]MBM1567084.1 MFS transporter [Sulfitobacter mediterraneus]MBM1570886.1 MFS transporter [Sulfitobacter mediterraneus]MBM1574686.1 MFS transporter [Sulfitobacter mediterraneus]MBM1578321.1 MFS transporter [Sulfitobacter mediterraneus]